MPIAILLLVGWTWVGTLIALIGYNLYLYVREASYLGQVLDGVLSKRTIDSREDLVLIKQYLSGAIAFDVEQRGTRRPLLRHGAMTILRAGYGFCGENSRVAIRLLLLGGIRANRLYLKGRKWDHVLVEHKWADVWTVFDGHSDPATLLPDAQVGSLDSCDFTRFPNAYGQMNPWVSSYRIKICHVFPPLGRMSQLRLPRFVVLIAETPALIRAIVFAIILLTLVGVLLA